MAASRQRRSADVDISQLNNLERLIFAQAVHEFGSNAWTDVSKLLSKHPLLSRPKNFFTPQACNFIYVHLMDAAGLESAEADARPRSATHLNLARRHYETRIIELRELIVSEEQKFKTLVTEIDEIRSGKWDNKILVSLGITLPAEVPDQPHLNGEAQETEEVLKALAAQPEPEERFEEPQLQVIEEEAAARSLTVEPAELHPDVEAVTEPVQVLKPQEVVAPEQVEPPVEPEITQVREVAEEDTATPVTAEEVSAEIVVEDEDIIASVKAETPEVSPEVSATVSDVVMETAEPSPFPEAIEVESPRDGKRKAAEIEQATPEAPSKRLRDESEQPTEEEEPEPSLALRTRRRGAVPEAPVISKKFQNVIGMLHSTISQHRYGNIFHNPIKKSEAPDYHDIVKRPMDLKTIKSRVKDGLITNSSEFQRDVYLMFANAMMYNRPGSEIYNMAEEMMLESEAHINTFRQTEGFHRL